MPHLDVVFADGRRERVVLSRATPLSIGSQTFNDLTISDTGVAAMHCRIGWNKSAYEVTAATSRGVDVNGTIVQHALLKPGDLLRIGDSDLKFGQETGDAVAALPAGKGERRGHESSKAKSHKKGKGDAFDDEPSARPQLKTRGHVEPPVSDPAVSQEIQEFPSQARKLAAEAQKAGTSPLAMLPRTTIGRELQGGRHRPGEQEILKSPLILILGGGSLVLLLIAVTLWLLLGRETSAKLYQQAEQDLAQAKYSQAIEQFEEYQRRYPRSSRALSARVNAAKARVQKELTGAAPAFSLAEERLQQLVREFRNTDAFRDLQPAIRTFADEIAQGAAQAAAATKDESLLTVSGAARQLLERSAGESEDLEPILARITAATARAEAAIARQKIRDAAVLKMKAALEAQQPIDALAEREALLRQLPIFRTDREIRELLQQALQAELATIAVDDRDQAPLPVEQDTPPRGVSPVYHARSRTSDSSLGLTVWALAQDVCYAVDTITGEVVWKRTIGFDPAFPPVTLRGDVTDWLIFDRRHGHLVRCRSDTGATVWRQALSAPPRGAPVVDEGQIYLVTANQELVRIDAETGRLTARMSFSQPISGPPTLDTPREFLFFPGDRGVIYAVRKRPLEPVAVTFTDHAAGAVQAPLTTVGRLLLLAENDRANSARLRLWNAADPTRALTAEIDQRAAGLVWDAPLLRGSHLVLPLQGERLSAYVLNDAEGRAEMSLIGSYRVQEGYAGPLHVALGPDQQFWMSSSGFRRFEIAADSVRMDTTAVALGLTSQPLQSLGEMFFVGRRAPFAEGVQFTNVDRQTLTGTWRTVLGARPVAAQVGEAQNLILTTESGIVANLTAARLAQDGVETNGVVDLDWPVTLTEPPLSRALANGRTAVAINSSPPKLWLIENSGRAGNPIELPGALEQSPLQLSAALILPLSGRLRPIQGARKYEEWRMPIEGDAPPRWTHLIQTDDEEFLAFDRSGRCRRMQLRGGEIPHLAEIASVSLSPLSTIPPVLMGETVIVVDEEQRLQQLDRRTLEPLATVTHTTPLLGIASSDSQLLVWDAGQVRSLKPQGDLQAAWTSKLDVSPPVGVPQQRGEMLWFGCRDGEILGLRRDSGAATVATTVPQTLSLGLIAIGDSLWAIASDSTVYRIALPAEAAP